MEAAHWAFNDGQRPPKDRWWFVGYVATLICTGVVAVAALINTNPLFHRAISDSRFMNNPDNCDASYPGRSLLATDDDWEEAFGLVVIKAILFSVAPAIIAGFAIIHFFRKAPQTMVTIGWWTPIAFCVAIATASIVEGAPMIAPSFLIPAAIFAFIFFRYRTQLQLVARLMKVACDSLAANLTLIPFALGANISAIPPLVALGAAIYFLQGNGTVEPNPDAMERLGTAGCLDSEGVATSCCAWQPARWVLPTQVAVGIVLLWTEAIVAQLRTYVMGGVITQWYFHEETRGTIPRSLRHALGPARGTLCFSGAVITVCDLIRSLADRIRNNRANPAYLLISCLFSWLLDLIQELIRFVSTLATIQAAATGEGFLEAARSVGAMLTRHSLSAVSVWWLPNVVLAWTLVGLSVIAGTATYGIARAMWKDSNRHDVRLDAFILSSIVSWTIFLLTGWLLGFIRSATEVVYVCFARDLDNRAVTRADVHAVLKDVPAASGAVVVQPDDNLVYGAMEQGDSPTAPLHRQPPSPEPARDLTAAIEQQPLQPPAKGEK